MTQTLRAHDLRQRYLYLHTDGEGALWESADDSEPVRCRAALEQLLAQNPAAIVRTIGVAANAKLICDLWSRREQLFGVQIAGPNVCEEPAELAVASVVIFRMRQCMLPASLGGWHAITAHDAAHYCLIAADGDDDTELLELVCKHPAWRYASFVAGIDPLSTALLLSEIGDPRWYIDGEHPDRVSRLHQFLGLVPRIHERVLRGDQERTLAMYRCRLVLRCWRNTEAIAMFDAAPFNPGGFLFQIAASRGNGNKALLRASQAFVTFLRFTWLQELQQQSLRGESLFDPRKFFGGDRVADAYIRHLGETS